LVVVAAVAAGVAVFVNRSPQSRLTAAAASSSTDGEYVQRLADCVACHSVANGAPFAGGLKMGTPLGALYATSVDGRKRIS
jgi:hypothetical protein